MPLEFGIIRRRLEQRIVGPNIIRQNHLFVDDPANDCGHGLVAARGLGLEELMFGAGEVNLRPEHCGRPLGSGIADGRFPQGLRLGLFKLTRFHTSTVCDAMYMCQALFNSAYSMLSTSACKLASTMFSLTPTVLQTSWLSVDSSRTRVFAAVPVPVSIIRTL